MQRRQDNLIKSLNNVEWGLKTLKETVHFKESPERVIVMYSLQEIQKIKRNVQRGTA